MDVIEKVESYIGADSRLDVRTLLRDDHEAILSLARSLAEEASAQQRRALFKSLKPLLTAHARAEEHDVLAEHLFDPPHDGRVVGHLEVRPRRHGAPLGPVQRRHPPRVAQYGEELPALLRGQRREGPGEAEIVELLEER
jgi:hypothetical protein